MYTSPTLPILFVTFLKYVLSDEPDDRKFGVWFITQLMEAVSMLDEGDDMMTCNGITQLDPESTWPQRYIANAGGPVPLPAGASKIHYTGLESENYFIEEDDRDLEDRDFLLLYLALETVSLHPDACLMNRLCLAATSTPPTTRRSSTPRWSGPLLRRRDRLRLSPDVFGDMRNWKTERISTVARTATRLAM